MNRNENCINSTTLSLNECNGLNCSLVREQDHSQEVCELPVFHTQSDSPNYPRTELSGKTKTRNIELAPFSCSNMSDVSISKAHCLRSPRAILEGSRFFREKGNINSARSLGTSIRTHSNQARSCFPDSQTVMVEIFPHPCTQSAPTAPTDEISPLPIRLDRCKPKDETEATQSPIFSSRASKFRIQSLPKAILSQILAFCDISMLFVFRAVCRTFEKTFLLHLIEDDELGAKICQNLLDESRGHGELDDCTIDGVKLTFALANHKKNLHRLQKGYTIWLHRFTREKLLRARSRSFLFSERIFRELERKGVRIQQQLNLVRSQCSMIVRRWLSCLAHTRRVYRNISQSLFNIVELPVALEGLIIPPVFLPGGFIALCTNQNKVSIFEKRHPHPLLSFTSFSKYSHDHDNCVDAHMFEASRSLWALRAEISTSHSITHIFHCPTYDALHICNSEGSVDVWRLKSNATQLSQNHLDSTRKASVSDQTILRSLEPSLVTMPLQQQATGTRSLNSTGGLPFEVIHAQDQNRTNETDLTDPVANNFCEWNIKATQEQLYDAKNWNMEFLGSYSIDFEARKSFFISITTQLELPNFEWTRKSLKVLTSGIPSLSGSLNSSSSTRIVKAQPGQSPNFISGKRIAPSIVVIRHSNDATRSVFPYLSNSGELNARDLYCMNRLQTYIFKRFLSGNESLTATTESKSWPLDFAKIKRTCNGDHSQNKYSYCVTKRRVVLGYSDTPSGSDTDSDNDVSLPGCDISVDEKSFHTEDTQLFTSKSARSQNAFPPIDIPDKKGARDQTLCFSGAENVQRRGDSSDAEKRPLHSATEDNTAVPKYLKPQRLIVGAFNEDCSFFCSISSEKQMKCYTLSLPFFYSQLSFNSVGKVQEVKILSEPTFGSTQVKEQSSHNYTEDQTNQDQETVGNAGGGANCESETLEQPNTDASGRKNPQQEQSNDISSLVIVCLSHTVAYLIKIPIQRMLISATLVEVRCALDCTCSNANNKNEEMECHEDREDYRAFPLNPLSPRRNQEKCSLPEAITTMYVMRGYWYFSPLGKGSEVLLEIKTPFFSSPRISPSLKIHKCTFNIDAQVGSSMANAHSRATLSPAESPIHAHSNLSPFASASRSYHPFFTKIFFLSSVSEHLKVGFPFMSAPSEEEVIAWNKVHPFYTVCPSDCLYIRTKPYLSNGIDRFSGSEICIETDPKLLPYCSGITALAISPYHSYFIAAQEGGALILIAPKCSANLAESKKKSVFTKKKDTNSAQTSLEKIFPEKNPPLEKGENHNLNPRESLYWPTLDNDNDNELQKLTQKPLRPTPLYINTSIENFLTSAKSKAPDMPSAANIEGHSSDVLDELEWVHSSPRLLLLNRAFTSEEVFGNKFHLDPVLQFLNRTLFRDVPVNNSDREGNRVSSLGNVKWQLRLPLNFAYIKPQCNSKDAVRTAVIDGWKLTTLSMLYEITVYDLSSLHGVRSESVGVKMSPGLTTLFSCSPFSHPSKHLSPYIDNEVVPDSNETYPISRWEQLCLNNYLGFVPRVTLPTAKISWNHGFLLLDQAPFTTAPLLLDFDGLYRYPHSLLDDYGKKIAEFSQQAWENLSEQLTGEMPQHRLTVPGLLDFVTQCEESKKPKKSKISDDSTFHEEKRAIKDIFTRFLSRNLMINISLGKNLEGPYAGKMYSVPDSAKETSYRFYFYKKIQLDAANRWKWVIDKLNSMIDCYYLGLDCAKTSCPALSRSEASRSPPYPIKRDVATPLQWNESILQAFPDQALMMFICKLFFTVSGNQLSSKEVTDLYIKSTLQCNPGRASSSTDPFQIRHSVQSNEQHDSIEFRCAEINLSALQKEIAGKALGSRAISFREASPLPGISEVGNYAPNSINGKSSALKIETQLWHDHYLSHAPHIKIPALRMYFKNFLSILIEALVSVYGLIVLFFCISHKHVSPVLLYSLSIIVPLILIEKIAVLDRKNHTLPDTGLVFAMRVAVQALYGIIFPVFLFWKLLPSSFSDTSVSDNFHNYGRLWIVVFSPIFLGLFIQILIDPILQCYYRRNASYLWNGNFLLKLGAILSVAALITLFSVYFDFPKTNNSHNGISRFSPPFNFFLTLVPIISFYIFFGAIELKIAIRRKNYSTFFGIIICYSIFLLMSIILIQAAHDYWATNEQQNIDKGFIYIASIVNFVSVIGLTFYSFCKFVAFYQRYNSR